MRSLGRALVAAAGLMSLLAPTAAVASWWDGGYDGRYDGGYDGRRGNNPTTTTTPRAEPGYDQPPESDTGPDDGQPEYGPPEYGPPAEERPPAPCNRQPECGPAPEERPAPCEQPSPCEQPAPCEQPSPCERPAPCEQPSACRPAPAPCEQPSPCEQPAPCEQPSACRPAPAPCEQPSPCERPAPCEQPSQCGPPPGPPPPPPPPPPPGAFGPIYGCENSDLADTHLLLHKTTTPPPGTPVLPGDEILVEITWRPFDWMGYDLHKVIDCVYINGLFVPELSGGEQPTPNDGYFAWHYFVPFDVPPGSEICDQGFVSGADSWDEYDRAVSNVVCFPIELPPPPPPPPCCAPPPVETTTTTTPEEDQPYIDVDRVEYEAPEETPPVVLPEQRGVLPRTGADSDPARLAAGALALALIAGRARRVRRG